MKRKTHPDKDIEAAVHSAINIGWKYVSPGKSAHAWGRLYCPLNDRSGCIISIWSTPRSTTTHARQIERAVKACPHSITGV